MYKTILIALLFLSNCFFILKAQEIKLDGKERNLKTIFEKVEKQCGLVTIFSNDELNMNNKPELPAGIYSVDELYKQLLKGTKLAFRKENKYIILAPAPTTKTTNNKEKISGVVKDDLGDPLPGVSIQDEATLSGTVTDLDGKYTLEVPAGSKLHFSFIGMKEEVFQVKASGTHNVTLTPLTEQLQEIVVTGYQKIDRRLFTGAAEKITAEEASIDGLADVSQMLQGKAAGVQVQAVSGTFGAAPKIRVRGASSIYGNQTPLWVVDGVVLEDIVEVSADDLSSGNASTLISSAVAGLNPDDIESFQILRDASATALYGARAMNGVVVVVTKKGKKGASSISYTGEYSIRFRPQYSQYNIMNSKDQIAVYMDMAEKGWFNYADISRNSNGGIYYKMYEMLEYDPTTGSFGIENSEQSRMLYLQQAEMRNTNWFNELFKPSFQNNHSLSITSGNDRSRNYASLSFYNDPGWTESDQVNRYTINMNTNYDIAKYLTLGFAATGSIRQQKVPGTNDRTEDVVNGEYTRDFDINPFSYALNTSRALETSKNGKQTFYQMNYAPFNIFNEQQNNYIDLSVADIKLQGEINMKPTSKIDLNLLGAMRYVKSTQEHKITEFSNLAQAYRAAEDAVIREYNKYLYSDPDHPEALPSVVLPKGGFYNTEDNRLLNYYGRATLNYNDAYRENHIVNFLAGSEIKYSDRQNRYNYGYGYEWSRGGIPNIDYRILKWMLEGNFDYYGMSEYFDRFAAFFITSSYSYDGMYTLNATGRYDGSNRLGRSRSARWLPTWNVSASTNLKRMPFLAQNLIISAATVRATYGLTASMGPANNALAIFRSDVTFRPSVDKESVTVIESLENCELTWEKQYELNIGFDLGLFNNRISLSLDGYRRNGFDLIGLSRNPGIGGETLKYSNYADMRSHGFEFTLNTRNIQTADFLWVSNLTFAYNKNKITNLESRTGVFDLIKSEGGALKGYPVRGLFSLQFKGLDERGLPTFLNEDNQITVTDINFQEMETLAHLKYEGSIDPTITGGLDNTLKWKDWKLGIFITYQGGNVLRLNPDFAASYSDLSAMPKELKNRWMQPGDEQSTWVPTIPSKQQYTLIKNLSRAYNAYNYSQVRVAKGDFIRLKEISVSYDFPKLLMERYLVNNLSLKLSASNLWLIYSDKKLNGQDPEFFRSGGVALPTPRQITLSLRTSF